MENEITELVAPKSTHETIAQVAIKEVVKAVIGLTVTTIVCSLVKRSQKRPAPIEVIIVENQTTPEKK